MPEIGEIKYGKELGRLDNNKFTWHACPVCGKERWVRFAKSKLNPMCKKCTAKVHGQQMQWDKCPSWKGGRRKNSKGYIDIMLKPDDFFYPMAVKGSGYVREHRLVMAKHLGRCLQSWEIVHHKNGVRDDNRFENLELGSSNGEHIKIHNLGYQDGFRKGYYDGKDKRIKELQVVIQNLESGRCSKD